MHIQLNGQHHALAHPLSLTELLATLDLADKPVVVELNREAVLPKNFPTTKINDDDQVEIITLAAGG